MSKKILMDGAEVFIGDQVYVLLHGPGVVTSVRDNGSFSVKTGRGEAMYAPSTFNGPDRRLFWHNPFIVVPPKHPIMWKAFYDMATTTFKSLLNVFNTGQVNIVKRKKKADSED